MTRNEIIKRYMYLYQNKELILALCINVGIEEDRLNKQIKNSKNILKKNKIVKENVDICNIFKQKIRDYSLELKYGKYYLMGNVSNDIVSMFEEFLFSDNSMESLNLYKHIEAVKCSEKYVESFNYLIESLEERRKFNILLKKIPTFTVWKILSYVQRKNKYNIIIEKALDKYYNLDRYVSYLDDSKAGYYVKEDDYLEEEMYHKYPNSIIMNDGIIIWPDENCFEIEDEYFDVLSERESLEYSHFEASDFMMTLSNMEMLDLETKASVREELLKGNALIKVK